ncbi:MAG: universal stress protein [Solirubrobacteraceae bacterium]
MILIAYDGSENGRATIAQAGVLFPGEPATVLTVWRRFVDTVARLGAGVGLLVDSGEADESFEQTAAEQAQQGAELALQAGLNATARTAVVDSTIADTILAEAAACGANAIVVGSRGRSGVRSLMLGSVSHNVLQHADLPVVVVPSPKVAQARAKRRHERA